MNPSISVIIPTYNRADFLPFAIDSALAQSWQPLEIIVVDDASTDGTSELISTKYGKNALIRYIRLDKNQGQFVCSDICAKKSLGAFIAFLDSDDIWLTNHLQVAVEEFTKYSETVAVLTQRGRIDVKGTVIQDVVVESLACEISNVLSKRIIFHPSRLVVDKEAWFSLPKNTVARNAGDYFQGVCLVHDYGSRVHIVPERTVWMRTHGNQSFHNARQLKDSLLEAVEAIFTAIPELLPIKTQVQATNLFHAAYFLWLSGDSMEGWLTLWEGIRIYPQGIAMKDFWISLSRLILPRCARRWSRSSK